MQLRCSVCLDAQPVNTPDIDDEDPRTQWIRRSFRADHVARCEGAVVTLELHAVEATLIDPLCWESYLRQAQPPPDVIVQADGFFLRDSARVCEDCWQAIQRYADFPDGLVSPESDGTDRAPAKVRPTTVATESPLRAPAVQHLPRTVCLPCYMEAMARVYPGAHLPALRDVVLD